MLIAFATLSPDAVRAEAAHTISGDLFFPHVSRVRPVGQPDTCATALSCQGTGPWGLHCGGFGTMRDAFSRQASDGSHDVVAVGDGAARFDPATGRWRVQVGADLSGLRALHLGAEDRGDGWAVGERTRLARLGANGCWVTDDMLINGSVTLTSVVYEGADRRGWAVGRQGSRGVLLRLRTVDGQAQWTDASGLVMGGLPPLTDFSLSTFDPPLHEAWLVSETTGQILRAQLGTTPDGEADVAKVTSRVEVTGPAGEPARPREIGMRHDEGWVAGEVHRPDGGSFVETWRHVGGDAWRPQFEQRSGNVVDLYFDNSLGRGRWWLGVTPAYADGVLRTITTADASRAWDHWDPYSPLATENEAEAGHGAIAPLPNDRVLYGLGDAAWVYDPSTWRWDEVLRRRRLVGVAPHGSGAWLLSASADTSEGHALLMSWDGSALAPVTQVDGPSEGLATLTAIDSGGGAAWAVGALGATYRQRGATGWWQSMPRVVGVDVLTDVAVASDATAWSIGRDELGRGGMWRFDDTERAWHRVADIERDLHAVAALAGDRAWSVGSGVACDCTPDGCRCEEGLSYAPSPGERPVEMSFSAVTAAAVGADTDVWASGDHAGASYVVRRAESGWRDAPALVLGSLPQGATIVDLVAGGSRDVWSLAVCQPYERDGRGVTIVNHFRGVEDVRNGRIEAHEALALSVPGHRLAVRQAEAGRRSVWLAGDWSSLLSLGYETSGPPGLHPPPVPDLRCVPALQQTRTNASPTE